MEGEGAVGADEAAEEDESAGADEAAGAGDAAEAAGDSPLSAVARSNAFKFPKKSPVGFTCERSISAHLRITEFLSLTETSLYDCGVCTATLRESSSADLHSVNANTPRSSPDKCGNAILIDCTKG